MESRIRIAAALAVLAFGSLAGRAAPCWSSSHLPEAAGPEHRARGSASPTP